MLLVLRDGACTTLARSRRSGCSVGENKGLVAHGTHDGSLPRLPGVGQIGPGNGPVVNGHSCVGLALLLPEDGLDGTVLVDDLLLEGLGALQMLDTAEGRFVLVHAGGASFPNVLFDAPTDAIVVLAGQPEGAARAAAAVLVDDGFERFEPPDGDGRNEANLFHYC